MVKITNWKPYTACYYPGGNAEGYRVAPILGIGREAAVTIDFIALYLGCSKREAQDVIRIERERGAAICASSSDPAGYWMAANRREWEQYILSLVYDEKDIRYRIRIYTMLAQALPDPDQVTLEQASQEETTSDQLRAGLEELGISLDDIPEDGLLAPFVEASREHPLGSDVTPVPEGQEITIQPGSSLSSGE